MDQAHCHKTGFIAEAIRDLNLESIMIPEGCTKHLQPLDAIVIANFKRKSTQFRIEYETEQIEKRSEKSGNIKALNRQQLINIVSKAWIEVQPETIVRAFELTGHYGVAHPKLFSHQTKLKNLIIKEI